MSAHELQQAVLGLSLGDRREVAMALLWSLPRTEVIALHAKLSQMMQKDIVGDLPPEISLRILSLLDVDDLVLCKGVSKTWARLCDDQAIWGEKCRLHVPPIEPAHTTWSDLTLHRQMLHSKGTSVATPLGDESFEYTSDDDMGQSLQLSPQALHFSPSSTTTNASAAGTPAPGLRRMVWERPHSSLPTYQRASVPSPSPSPFRTKDSIHDPPIQSHLHLPTGLPKANYKHLYLLRRILSRRMTDTRPADNEPALGGGKSSWNPKVTIVKPTASAEAGGLPGHTESIYSLHLFRHHMKIPMATDLDDMMHGLRTTWPSTPAGSPMATRASPRAAPATDVFGTPLAGWPGMNASLGIVQPPASPQMAPTIVTGRDWLLSGSRDHTLRLWQIGVPAPRVVKIFSGGHTGSILSHYVVEVDFGSPPSSRRSMQRSPRGSTPSRDSTPSGKRLMAVSGGSDGRICLWDIEHGDGTPEKVIEAHADSVLFVRGDERRIVSCSKDRTIRLFDIRTLEQTLVIDDSGPSSHRGAINAVGLTNDFIVSASGDRTIKVWDARDGSLLASMTAGDRGISCVGFEPISSPLAGWVPDKPGSVLCGTLVTGSSDATIKTFHLVRLPPGVVPGSGTALGDDSEAVTFRDMLDLERELPLAGSLGSSVGANDEDRGAIVIQRGVEYKAPCTCPSPLARPTPGGCTRCMDRGHSALVRSLHVCDEMTLSASYDSTIKMWDRQSGKLIFDFEGCHASRVFAITGDRVRVVSAGLDARITIVDFAEGLDTSFV